MERETSLPSQSPLQERQISVKDLLMEVFTVLEGCVGYFGSQFDRSVYKPVIQSQIEIIISKTILDKYGTSLYMLFNGVANFSSP